MTETLEAFAPAKVNLGLRILARRTDGYHELTSVFAPLDLADRLVLRVAESAAPGVSLSVTGAPDVPAGEENLAARAARGFLAESGLPLSVEIELEKQIPAGAGLGGGSSDAGAVLRALSAARPGGIGGARLRQLALSLGADVPFFLDPRPARVSGIGERLEPLSLPALCLLLVNPGVTLPTAEVYRAFDALVPDPSRGAAGRARGETLPLPGAPALLLDNDLEPAAVRLCPALRRLRQQLRGTAPLATGMSGSGPTLFGVYPERAAAEAARQRGGFPTGVWTRVAATLKSG